jgi:sulfotransferase family protein
VELTERYSAVDRQLHRLAFATADMQVELAALEDIIYRKSLANTPVNRPVFITGLPRAGTTLLLQLTSALDGFASHSYRDMPFVLLPMLWNSFSRGFRQDAPPTERAHGDGMLVDLDSAEAFEEMLWRVKWPEHYAPDRIVPWHAHDDPEPAEAITSHMRKVIRLRQRRQDVVPRYLSKNNGNIARTEYLRSCWPEAVIIVPVREPVQHATSLLRQHQRFLELHGRDGFSREYMQGIGHFDFGANLRPIDFAGWLSTARHADPLTIGFWLEYWTAAYGWLDDHAATLHFLPYEHFCADPDRGLRWLADVLEIEDRQGLTTDRAIRLAPPRPVDLTGVASSALTSANEIYRTLLQRSDLIPAIA